MEFVFQSDGDGLSLKIQRQLNSRTDLFWWIVLNTLSVVRDQNCTTNAFEPPRRTTAMSSEHLPKTHRVLRRGVERALSDNPFDTNDQIEQTGYPPRFIDRVV